MNTTKLIEELQRLEFGASLRPREISFVVRREGEEDIYLHEPEIVRDSTGDGICGAEVCFSLIDKKTI